MMPGRKEADASVIDEAGLVHTNMMEIQTLLEASGERIAGSINLNRGEQRCQCMEETSWYPEKSYLCVIWYVEGFFCLSL